MPLIEFGISIAQCLSFPMKRFLKIQRSTQKNNPLMILFEIVPNIFNVILRFQIFFHKEIHIIFVQYEVMNQNIMVTNLS